MRASLTALALVITGAFVLGCGAEDEIDDEVDCNNICDRYAECYDTDYDTEACENRCENYLENVDSGAADECDACLDERSCVEATFSCISECDGIIP